MYLKVDNNNRFARMRKFEEKRVVSSGYLVIAVVIVYITFSSCGKNEYYEICGNNYEFKLLEAIFYSGYDSYDKYEYDNQNRLVKISRYRNYENNYKADLVQIETLVYAGDHFIRYTFFDYLGSEFKIEFLKKGEEISIMDKNRKGETMAFQSMVLDNNGFPAKIEYYGTDGCNSIVSYQFQAGNMTKISSYSCSGEIYDWSREYEYDNQKSPLYNCTTPKWCLFYLFLVTDINGSQNNVINASYSDNSIEHEYDCTGFLTRTIIKHKESYFDDSIFKYKYKCNYKIFKNKIIK